MSLPRRQHARANANETACETETRVKISLLLGSPWFLVLLAPCEPLLELISHQLTYAAFLGGRGVASGASGSHGGSSNVFSV